MIQVVLHLGFDTHMIYLPLHCIYLIQPLDVGCFRLLQNAYQGGLRQLRGASENPTAIMTKVILDGLDFNGGKHRVMTQKRLTRTLKH